MSSECSVPRLGVFGARHTKWEPGRSEPADAVAGTTLNAKVHLLRKNRHIGADTEAAASTRIVEGDGSGGDRIRASNTWASPRQWACPSNEHRCAGGGCDDG